jgi:cell division protein FtsI (penicillin-binding protein 3)
MNKKTELLTRLYTVVGIFLLLSCVIGFRVFKVSILENEKWKNKGSANLKWKELEADRGTIYADDGSILATSLQFFEIRIDMVTLKQNLYKKSIDSLAFYLSTTIRPDQSRSEWKKALTQAKAKGNRYFFIAKDLSVEQLKLIKTFPIFKAKKNDSGLIVVKSSKRSKPYRELASRTIGTNRDNAEKIGIEGAFDKFLKGPSEKVLQKKLSNNIWIPVEEPQEMGTYRGDDVVTTINIRHQDIVHTELMTAMTKYSSKKGVAILMEVKTGQIKAISNLARDESSISEVQNFAVAERSEPGSTFKLATAIALIEGGHADLNTLVDLNGGRPVRFSDRLIKDSKEHGIGTTTFKQAFAISSNIGMARLANLAFNKDELGRKEFRRRINELMIDQKTGIEIEGEPTPSIKDPVKDEKSWYGTTIPYMAHGYETAVTPLQMLNLYNAVANNGTLMRPYLVSKIKSDTEDKKVFTPRVLKDKIVSDETLAKVKELLNEVVLTGSATNIKTEQFGIAGKTGTTRVNYTNKEEYAKYNASFAGYFPSDKPIYSLIVVVYEPEGAFYGNSVAAPVFKNIAEKIMAFEVQSYSAINEPENNKTSIKTPNTIPTEEAGYGLDFKGIFDFLGIPYKDKADKKWVYVDPYESKMIIENKQIKTKTVPDVRGMGARDAVFVLENLGLGVTIQGSGKVTRMSLSPGTSIRGQRIELYLN